MDLKRGAPCVCSFARDDDAEGGRRERREELLEERLAAR